MFKKLLGKVIRKVIKNKLAAEVIADKVDRAIVKEADKRTGGLASKIDEVI